MYSLNFDRTSFASIRIDRVSARAGVGDHALLVAQVRVQNTAPVQPNAPRVVHFAGEIKYRDDEHIGEIRRCTLVWRSSLTSGETIHLCAPVTFSTLSSINDSRRSGAENVNLGFELAVELDGPHGWEQQRLEMQHRVPASDWVNLLSQARHSTFALVELPYDGLPVPAGLRGAMDRYRAAKNHLQQCQWDDAIAECREVLDALHSAIGATEPTPQLSGLSATWTFDERCGAMRAIARHATHPAHHGQAQFGVEQAHYIVNLVGVMLKFYCERLGR